ncbi:NAD(P)-dependent alcohol dehydrogenase [Sinomonas atrocyanea]|uniref:NAD(P)-dependent alcohol dehydrogenase n=1 Tax=Sinomonas atrocyanea TaxID=37927 RepID=UPI0027821B2D|nr:NAD(P)-dependent alcohol dehydrogenase [Sinomonas atrocyanea]MDQ0258325.1 putative zinc-type alcohol dehydrogenase-like protein [Sinomonas atrocyanea]MDR6620593.1 putative zinc-type alcohol dehydrogenase-like protein [Sinomonas atrocyanea]
MTPGRPVMPSADTIRENLAEELGRGTPGSGGSDVHAYGATSASSGLVPLTIARREPGTRDVEIDIEFCGLCHSDVHATRGEWGERPWPLVPGHEIVGRVRRTGSAVQGFAVGDRVGVGCMVDSCRECAHCRAGLEQYCERGMVGTYGAPDPRHGGEATQGGYSERIVVDAAYVLRIPDALDPAAAAPILCAGITTYSPLRRFGVGPGRRVGVVGLGGLGHLAVKLAAALGAEVTVFTRTAAKAADAAQLGAHRVVVTTDPAQLEAAEGTLDVVLDTVAAPHDVNVYLSVLRFDGVLVALSLPSGDLPPVQPGALIRRRLAYTGSLIGGIAETQEVLDFCAEHGVAPQIEVVTAESLNEAYDRMVASDVKYRFVLDAASLRGAGAPSRREQ